MLIESIAAVLLAYLLGMFPTAYVVSRLYAGVDIRRLGSENPGALNTYRQVGAKAGLTGPGLRRRLKGPHSDRRG